MRRISDEDVYHRFGVGRSVVIYFECEMGTVSEGDAVDYLGVEHRVTEVTHGNELDSAKAESTYRRVVTVEEKLDEGS